MAANALCEFSGSIIQRLSARLGLLAACLSLTFLASSTQAGVVGLQRVASGISRPTFVTHAPGDPNRLFITQQSGNIRVLNLTTGVVEPTPFLTIPDTLMEVESGLVGLAFHPDYQSNGKFYTYVTASNGGASYLSAYVREYTVSSNPNVANTTYNQILEVQRPSNTHVAGWMGFSPNDNYLYIASGDGGGAHDTGDGHTPGIGNAQDLTDNLMGKILRIDVNSDAFTDDPERNYAIPANNPFVGVEGDDEIWAYGLRNPYRGGFDRGTGDLWIGDVGQATREEINFISAESPGGVNFGWRLREGTVATPTGGVGGPKPPGAVDPVFEHIHDAPGVGGAIFGGYVYRGPDPELQGEYFFGDSVSHNLWTLESEDVRQNPGGPPVTATLINDLLPPDVGTLIYPVSYGEDLEGDLYLAFYYSQAIYRVVTDALTPGDFNGDATVDGADLQRWQEGFGMASGATAADGDGDGDVDGADFLAWQQNAGWSPLNVASPTTTPTPEPSAALLGVIAVAPAAIFAVRRRRRA
jgi:glucose/arabinose dehydrogenase